MIELSDNKNVKFHYQGEDYLLQDKEFTKMSPKLTNPTHVDDGLSLYSMLQRNALVYNIFITDIEDITTWNMDPGTNPPTYPIHTDDVDYNSQAYQRGATALYSKLSSIDFSKVRTYQEFLKYEAPSQDGYRVLYAILSVCHPKIVERAEMKKPTLIDKPNLFTYLRHYNNWLEYERVSARVYSPMEQLTNIMENLARDPSQRFDKALTTLRLKKQLHQNLLKSDSTIPFPPQLLLDQLPYTIMNEYEPEEHGSLFEDSGATTSDDDTDTAIINRFNNIRKRDHKPTNITSRPSSFTPRSQNNQYPPRNNQLLRTRLNRFCPSCGTYGHDIAINGCDFTARLIKALDYIKQNPHQIKKILDFHFQYQGQRIKTLQQKGTTSNRFQTLARKKNLNFGPQVKLLMDVVGDTVDDLLQEDSEEIDDSSILDLVNDTLDAPVDLEEDNFQDTSDHQE